MNLDKKLENIKERRGGGALWLTIYSDLMTNLMLFFLMLFGVTRIGVTARDAVFESIQKKFSGAGKNIEQIYEEEVVDKIEDYIEQENLRSFARIKVNEQRVRITLSSPVLFDLGKSELKPSVKAILSEIAGLIKELPNNIIVEGHTDNKPIRRGRFASNWELSIARAFSVIKYFINQEGIKPQRLSAVGYGEYKPLYSNDTDEHCALNRRIEIDIVRIP